MKPFKRFQDLQSRPFKRWMILPCSYSFYFLNLFIFLSAFFATTTNAQQTRNFVDAMVNLNDDWETKPEILMESLNYFYRSSRLSNSKANDLLFIKAILENPVAMNALNKRVGNMALAKFYQAVQVKPEELNSRLDFNHDICDFKPHYICRLAFEKGFSLLRLFYEDDFRSVEVQSGRVDTWYETKDHKIALRISNSYAYKDFKFFELDISDKTSIHFSNVPSEPVASVQKNNVTNFRLDNQKVVSQLADKFKNQRISVFSKAIRFKQQNLTLIATDAGLCIYDTKTAQLLKFIKNFYTGNDVE
jgi:hypothetical protein